MATDTDKVTIVTPDKPNIKERLRKKVLKWLDVNPKELKQDYEKAIKELKKENEEYKKALAQSNDLNQDKLALQLDTFWRQLYKLENEILGELVFGFDGFERVKKKPVASPQIDKGKAE